jgi:DNA (cytosine-5)-methyltransferase 1
MLSVIDLFSCVGGHAIGLHATEKFTTSAFVEADPWRRRVLETRFPGVQIHDDVRTYKPERADLVVGGPPCQKTSVAAAIHGRRSGQSLWPEMRRIAAEAECDWVVVEQPPGNEPWEAQVASDLAADGRHVARVEFSARDLGAAHLRRRVFLLAHASLPRLEVAWAAIPQEIDRAARTAAAGNPWLSGVPRTLRVADGVPGRMDAAAAAAVRGERNDRSERIEALGDSNPPIMMTVIGRAIAGASDA